MQNLKILNQICEEREITLYVIRGNHDDPAFWYMHDMTAFNNIIFVKDYSIVEIEGQKILFAGGGVSIDRCYRTVSNMPHFKGEEFVLDEEKLKLITEAEDKIDIVVTHNAPHFFEPAGVNSFLVEQHIMYEKSKWGTNLRSSLIKERQDIEKMHDILLEKFHVKDWIYGHFHRSFRGIHKNIRSTGEEITTNHILLNINEFYEHNKTEHRDKAIRRTEKTKSKKIS